MCIPVFHTESWSWEFARVGTQNSREGRVIQLRYMYIVAFIFLEEGGGGGIWGGGE